MSRFAELTRRLDSVMLTEPGDWLNQLQEIRVAADAASESGELQQDEWSNLVCRSARVQDQLNMRLT
jgi:hypothetical protein